MSRLIHELSEKRCYSSVSSGSNRIKSPVQGSESCPSGTPMVRWDAHPDGQNSFPQDTSGCRNGVTCSVKWKKERRVKHTDDRAKAWTFYVPPQPVRAPPAKCLWPMTSG